MASPQRIIVTGAAQGIGRAVALRLAAHGVHVAVWDMQHNGVEETAKLCREKGATSRAFTLDVGNTDAIEAAVADFDQVLRLNLTGTFVTARAVAARMKDEGRGAIVNTASGRALAGAANGAHYSASKGGIIALTKSLALDWAGYGIRVNCVIPGLTDTAQPRVEMGDNELYAAGARIPMGRIGRPEDIAAVVAFLLSDDAGYMTGQSVAANGGAIMTP
jgi:2-hydroxycyclohexanecarboxyl-CoA dehydrogenase